MHRIPLASIAQYCTYEVDWMLDKGSLCSLGVLCVKGLRYALKGVGLWRLVLALEGVGLWRLFGFLEGVGLSGLFRLPGGIILQRLTWGGPLLWLWA